MFSVGTGNKTVQTPALFEYAADTRKEMLDLEATVGAAPGSAGGLDALLSNIVAIAER
jgi:hypothetical protein